MPQNPQSWKAVAAKSRTPKFGDGNVNIAFMASTQPFSGKSSTIPSLITWPHLLLPTVLIWMMLT